MTISVEVKPGDKVLFVGYLAAWIEEVVKVTDKFAMTKARDPLFDDNNGLVRLHKGLIHPVPDGVAGVVGCYRRRR